LERRPSHGISLLTSWSGRWSNSKVSWAEDLAEPRTRREFLVRRCLVETYHSKVLYEMAPLGLILLLSLFTVLVVTTFKAYRSIKDQNLRGYGAAMFTFVLFISYFPYYYPLDVDPVNVYYWLAAGIALKLPDLDRQERAKNTDTGKKLTKKELKQLQKSQKSIEFRWP
jgi:hypothetical protein